MRQGELFGLHWADIDFEAMTARVERQAVESRGCVKIKPPKTKAGRRTLTLSAPVVSALSDRRRLAMAEGHAGSNFVFTNQRGGVVRRSNFGNRHWRKLLERLSLEHRGFHHCRHTAATLMLAGGVPLHVVSRVLGHSKPSITLDLYAHYIEADGGQAADVMARAVR